MAQLLKSPLHKIKSLCLDSTCLGRNGFINIMKAAAESPYLMYLDVAETQFMPQTISPKSRRDSTEMDDYHKQEAIDAVLTLLESPKNQLQHLIIGHNKIDYQDCRLIAEIAAIRGLTTLDLFGNNINTPQLIDIHQMLYNHRLKLLMKEIKNNKIIPICIATLIAEYTVHQTQCLYRCCKWRPRN